MEGVVGRRTRATRVRRMARMESERPAPPSRTAAAEVPSFAARRRRHARVLLAAGGEDAQERYAAALVRAGFDVQVATDGLETLARAVARRPDAIVIDVTVPVMDGWEVTRRLKAAAATRDIPVIAVTSSDEGARAYAAEAGCAACLPKPCRPEDLEEEVVRQLGAYRPRPRRRGRAGRG